jgi:hypothetical protein
MADETVTVKMRLRPIVAVGLAGVISLVGAALLTPPDPVSMLLMAAPCLVVAVAANLAILLPLRSWPLWKAAALAAVVDALVVLAAWGLLSVDW